MRVEEAERLAERLRTPLLAEVQKRRELVGYYEGQEESSPGKATKALERARRRLLQAEREQRRVQSDLDGLRDHAHMVDEDGEPFRYCMCRKPVEECPDNRRYSGGLLDTCAAHGVEP